MKRTLLIAGAVTLAFAASAVPAFGDDNGTIAATVTAASACITVTPAAAPLGTLAFSTSAGSSVGTINPTLRSCTPMAQKLFARGTDAVASGATWQLDGAAPCPGSLNRYGVNASGFPGSTFEAPLSTTDQQVASLSPNQAAAGELLVLMPCTGSAGAGIEMSFSIVFTATL